MPAKKEVGSKAKKAIPKKTKPKKTRKNTNKKRNQAKKKADKPVKIKKMPGIIFQELQNNKSVKTKKTINKPVQANKPQLIIKPENRSAKRLMWFSVSLFTLVILGLWGWAMKIQLDNLNLKKTPENQLLQKSQTEWNKIFTDTQTQQQQTKKTAEIKKKLQTIIASLVASSTTSTITTNTISTVATTTPTTTTSTTNLK